MALTREKKTEKVKKLAAELESSTSRHRRHLSGLTASKDFELRKTVRAAGGSYHVRQEQAGGACREGHARLSGAAGAQGRLLRRLHLGRSGGAGQGALHLGEGQRGVHLQAGHRRRQGHHVRGDRRAGDHAGQGGALLEAALPDQLAGAASGDGDQATGRDLAVVVNQAVEKEQVCRSAAAPAAEQRLRQKQRRQIAAASRSRGFSQGRSGCPCRGVGGRRAAFGRSTAGELRRIAGWRGCATDPVEG